MLLLNIKPMAQFMRKHPQSRRPLEEWAEVVERMEWTSLADVRRTFPSADGVMVASGGIATVFNIAGNKYRLAAIVNYRSQTVVIGEVMTHAEYNKDTWKDRL